MDDQRFARALAAFDAANSADPNLLRVEGVERPRELVQAERFSRWLERLEPDASEALRLAARCQHIRRWSRPRSDYPAGRTGYLQWRKDLAHFHAAAASEILENVGYPPELIDRVRRINLKQGLKTSPETQTMEDVLCLSFIEHELADFATRHDDEKIIDILRKTWRKMSPRAQALARGVALPTRLEALLASALAARD